MFANSGGIVSRTAGAWKNEIKMFQTIRGEPIGYPCHITMKLEAYHAIKWNCADFFFYYDWCEYRQGTRSRVVVLWRIQTKSRRDIQLKKVRENTFTRL